MVCKVRADQTYATVKVEDFVTGLVTKKERLDELRINARKLNRDGSITEKIRQRQKITEELRECIRTKLGSFSLDTYTMPPREGQLIQYLKVSFGII